MADIIYYGPLTIQILNKRGRDVLRATALLERNKQVAQALGMTELGVRDVRHRMRVRFGIRHLRKAEFMAVVKELAQQPEPAEEYRNFNFKPKPKPKPKNLWEAAKTLTRRETEVLQLIADGNATKAIAAKLQIAERTAEFYRTHIRKKLNIPSGHNMQPTAVRAVYGKPQP